MLGTIKDLLEVAQGLLGFGDRFKAARRDRRDRIAAYMGDVGALLEDVAGRLRRGEYPHGACAQLEFLADRLPETVADEIGQAEAMGWGDRLRLAHRVEALFSQLQGVPDRDAELAGIERTSGIFKGLAATLRAASPK